ncbi:hypothetical protein BC831DRAFT_441195 [Entophlyctis helioformis]|nr:hypothetical protein BC831DRAFT_441195 [Entophlyctis helioformis]
MTAMDMTDLIILGSIGVLTLGLFYWRSAKDPARPSAPGSAIGHKGSAPATPSRPGTPVLRKAPTKKSLVEKAKSLNASNRLFVFYGSQTGTAEDLATRIAKEASASLGVAALICDPEDYDMKELANWPLTDGKDLFGFFLATYGEGEPTDNAVEFYSWLMDGKGLGEDAGDEDDDMTFERPVEGLSYFIFALGNKTYEHYNAIGRRAFKRLEKLGALPVLPIGEGDDDGSLEEDFLAWKPKVMAAVSTFFGLDGVKTVSQRDRPHVPVYDVVDGKPKSQAAVFRGEHTIDTPRRWEAALTEAATEGFEMLEADQQYKEVTKIVTYDAKHPFYGRVVASRPLFTKTADTFDFTGSGAEMPSGGDPPKWSVSGTSKIVVQRDCYHMELDLSGSRLKYTTGDHVGVWPENSPAEVGRLARLLKIDTLDRVIDMVPNPKNPLPNTKKPFPMPCTLRAALTNYLDITDVLKQFHFDILAKYATAPADRERLLAISEDRALYVSLIEKGRKNLADVVAEFPSIQVPLGVVLGEILTRTAVRYYSISSSSKEEPTRVSLTAVVVRYAVASPAAGLALPGGSARKAKVVLKEGLATSWLQRQHDARTGTGAALATETSVPPLHLPLYIRSSTFRLPANHQTPIVMVGPGTGVAPFRGFVHERVLAAKQGSTVGPTWLFYGCRNSESDFLYRDEFEAFESQAANGLPIDLHIVTAFSRQGAQKVYVQHRITEYARDVWRLLHTLRGSFYICGDAKHMAHDVVNALEAMAVSVGGLSNDGAKQWIKDMRASGRYLEDVWS